MPDNRSVTKALVPVKATLLDDDAFRLLAFPFGGPIPSKANPRGMDLDGEWFSERTDIRPDWLPWRPVDWHHGKDRLMGRTMLGKAGDIGRREGKADEPDDEGWWVTVWLEHGQKRTDLIKRLAAQAPLYGSSESVPGMTRKASNGEILAWPYWRQTLSTSPQNTLSTIVPMKATLDEMAAAGGVPGPAFWADIEDALRSLAPSFRLPSAEAGAKSGLATLETDDQAALDAAQEFRAALERFESVVRHQ